ncbi:MAG: AEC family transporter [Clostridiales bacterium]|jgi:predicted permease|nr:AEC family transporter [Clostridiales bacterium]
MASNAIQSVLGILVLIGVGYALYGCEWFGAKGMALFSKFAVCIAIPCYMLFNVYTICETPEQLLRLLKALPIPTSIIILNLVLAVLLSRLFNIKSSRRGVFINSVGFCNAVIVGFPVVEALMGSDALPDAIVFYFANTMLFWTIGVYLLRSGKEKSEGAPIDLLCNVKKMFSPALVACFIAAFMTLGDIELPKAVFFPIEQLSRSTTSISMIFIGCVVRSTDFKSIEFSKDLILVSLMRFIFSPLIMFLFCLILPISTRMKQTFFVFSVMPAMTQLGIMAKETGSDYRFASVAVTVTTLLSMLFIPLYMWLMQSIDVF